MLQPTLTSLASDIAYKIRNNRKLNDSDISRGYLIYENVWQHNPELLEEADSLAEQDRAKAAETSDTMSPVNGQDEITLELIQAMVEWDKRRRILEDWKWKAMKDVADGIKPLTDRMKYAFYFNLQKLKKVDSPIDESHGYLEQRKKIGGHVPNQEQGYEAGSYASQGPFCPRISLSCQCQDSSRETGHRSASIQDGPFRSWMFLARTSRLQICIHPKEQYGILG